MAVETKIILDLGNGTPVLRMESAQMKNELARIELTAETCRKLDRLLSHAKQWIEEEAKKE